MQITQTSQQTGAHLLISLEHKQLSVSALSSLLRVVQAALRQVAKAGQNTGRYFDRSPNPVLILSPVVIDDSLELRFAFADPSTKAPLEDLSSNCFQAFMASFIQCLKAQPQRGLWGISSKAPQRRQYPSELERRLDKLRVELRRFPQATVIYGGHSILMEGDRIEIGEPHVP